MYMQVSVRVCVKFRLTYTSLLLKPMKSEASYSVFQ